MNISTKLATRYHAPDSGVFLLLPSSWVPYAELMRLDRPSGYYAFYWHYAIGLAFGACIAPQLVSPTALVAFTGYLALWVVILRGAVCTWNDNLDQEFDRKVIRTRFRPIARGAVSTAQGHVFTLIQTVVGAVMLMPLPWAVPAYAAIMMAILTIYPLGKRVTDFPQVILGIGFAIPIFMCCAALDTDPLLQPELFGEPEAVAMKWGGACLYCASVLWTIIFDTVYAHQDIKDDVNAGVRSLAVRLGDHTKPGLGFLGAIQISLLVGVGRLCNFSVFYFMVSCGGAASALIAMLWFGPGSRFVRASVVVGLLGHYAFRWTSK
ncbi:putative 4-hydroxybenzoate polyprenyl transferase [Mollisia scopiformis]|uniref:Putative 4-hydroxybenzoate polyprenyl transferase n=1 Tax=Mollisia scopiformis TaxID=149040 RepID=A0A194XA80_MOLSC|nr:putative 4-hydroxybenzoate polyprenyl transferase [Mollisia scopiformis]KUJ17078.1 putative 4-hydroxybenzoate polyprenyl transferase [Mollisia scopiformis]